MVKSQSLESRGETKKVKDDGFATIISFPLIACRLRFLNHFSLPSHQSCNKGNLIKNFFFIKKTHRSEKIANLLRK